MVNYCDEYDLTFGLITETWLKQSRETNNAIGDLLDGSGIELIRKDRGKRGGGVAIAFDTKKATLKKYPMRNNHHKIVCSTGKGNSSSRKLVLFAVYLPPKQTAAVTRDVASCLADNILQLKTELSNPLIIVAGDLNKKRIDSAFDESPDIHAHNAIPTCGDAALDVVFSNLAKHSECSLPPLSSDEGPRSDHNVLLIRAEEDLVHHYEKIRIRHRRFTDEGRNLFKTLILAQDWSDVRSAPSSSAAALALHQTLTRLLDQCFPWKEFTIKSTDPPWMNGDIRRCSKRKRRCFRLHGRGPEYRELEKQMDRLLKKAKGEFFENIKHELLENGDVRDYHKAVKRFSSKEAPVPWDLRIMMPGKSDWERCEEVAAYFNQISDEFEPLLEPLHVGQAGDPPELHRIAARLRSMRKPRSQVVGDIPPNLVTEYSDILAVPLSEVFSKIYTTAVWPEFGSEKQLLLFRRPTHLHLSPNSAISLALHYSPNFSKASSLMT